MDTLFIAEMKEDEHQVLPLYDLYINTALTFSNRGCIFGIMFLKMGFSVKSDRSDTSDESDMSDGSDGSDFDGDGG